MPAAAKVAAGVADQPWSLTQIAEQLDLRRDYASGVTAHAKQRVLAVYVQSTTALALARFRVKV